MGHTARIAIALELQAAASDAARWLPGFYPGVAAKLGDDAIELSSAHHDEAGLEAIWTAALANAALFERGRGQRAAALEALAR